MRPVWAWAFTIAVVAASLGLRVEHRGDFVPGWDVLSAAQGLWLVSTKTAADIAAWYVRFQGDTSVFWNLYVAPAVLLPGALARLVPWLYWNHVVSFTVSVVVLALLASAFRLGWRDAWIVPLAWATSPALVSQSVVGLAVVTALLPHAVAIWTVMRLRARPFATLAMGALVWLLGWQGQELGRTAGLVFVVAATTGRGGRATRCVWLAIGGALLVDAVVHPSTNTSFFAAVGVPTISQGVDVLAGVGRRLVAPPWIDLPTLVVVGAVATVLVRPDGWLWRLLLAAQIGLVMVLALQRDVTGVWPRRFVVLDLYALVAVVALAADWRRAGRVAASRALVAVLSVGALWQVADTVRFVRAGFEPASGEAAFTLPFVHTTVDYQVVPQDVRWARQMIADATDGRRLVLAYNFSSYEENATNPSAIPERLYLALGPERFARDVAFFGDGWRWTDLRARPPRDIDAFVAGIDDPERWVGWYALHPNDEWDENIEGTRRRTEVDALLRALERRFVLRWKAPLPGGPSHIQRFTLWPQASSGGR